MGFSVNTASSNAMIVRWSGAPEDVCRGSPGDTGNTMALSDTSQRTTEVYFQRLAEMTPSERIGIAVALWNAGDSLQRAATRRTYPEADESEINFRLAVTRFGAQLARKAYPAVKA
jgi:Rv0078B-related antitoxin